MKKIFGVLFGVMLTVLFCWMGGENISAATYYDTCVPGNSEQGYYIVKISKASLTKDSMCRELQAALDEAKTKATETMKYKIVVEPGVYDVSTCIHAYGNTYLYAQGVTFKVKDYEGNLFKVGDIGGSGDSKKGYYYKNIVVDGGIWDGQGENGTLIKVAHAQNFTMMNATVKNVTNSHVIEVAGVDGFTVKKCKFLDQVFTGNASEDKLANEVIQLDIMVEDHFNGYANEVLDMKNVLIEDNIFQNVLRGVGSHTAYARRTTDNVTIINNTFSNVKSVAIEGFNYTNCTIKDNTLERCGRGIAVYSMRESGSGTYNGTPTKDIPLNASTVIENNTITTIKTDTYSPAGITVEGWNLTKDTKSSGDKIAKGNYYIRNVVIKNNKITTGGYGIRLADAKSCVLTDNIIVSKDVDSNDKNKDKYDGIFLTSGSTGAKITNNSISAMSRNGIFCMDNSGPDSISGNEVFFNKKYGIGIYNGSKMSGDISNNIINNCNGSGISVSTKSSVKNIIGNTINNTKDTGIVIYKNSSVKGGINKNSVKSAKKCSISITTGSSTGTINNNILSEAGTNAILIYNKSTVKNIETNKISGTKGHAISISSIKNKATISKNTLNKVSGNGIMIQPNTKKYKITVTGNKITVAKKRYAIRATSGYVSVTKNTMNKKCLGISLASGVKGKAKNNKKK